MPPTAPCPLHATYRVQLGGGMNFDRLVGLLSYFKDLGISHLYLSPIWKARSGSSHGYDVVDPQRVNPELGGEEGFERLCRKAREVGLGLVLDIVPNHMAATPENPWWWDVLARGRSSPYAGFFDIDWDSPDPERRGKILLAVLPAPLAACLKARRIRVFRSAGEFRLRCPGLELPLCPASQRMLEADGLQGKGDDAKADAWLRRFNGKPHRLRELLELQHYRLAGWREANQRLNYRRFFDIQGLVGVCVETPEVFEATHRLIRRWLRRGWIEGLRIDHPDGQRDPRGYLKRLRSERASLWVVVEKILMPEEVLPSDWPVEGTTGYDVLNRILGLFVDSRHEPALTQCYAQFTGRSGNFYSLAGDAKREVLGRLFAAERDRLVYLLVQSAGGDSAAGSLFWEEAQNALEGVLAAFPVYRTYIDPSSAAVHPRDRRIVREAVVLACKKWPGISGRALAWIEDLLLLRRRGAAAGEFVYRFQQLSAAVMAKGVEDTAFYRYPRLLALNEVGGDPGAFGVPLEAFHAFCRRIQAAWPKTMSATATHDTKRGEDARLRMALLSQIPSAWHEAVFRWSQHNAHLRCGEFPDRTAEYFFYQTVVGAWPIGFRRLYEVMRKACREAKEYTCWLDPNRQFEEALESFVRGALGHRAFLRDLRGFLRRYQWPIQVSCLSQCLLKCTVPGIPDIYQGTELWDLNQVDPDNRRPVDFERRRRMIRSLGRLSLGEIVAQAAQGLPKLFVLRRVLATRRRFAEVFGGEGVYRPLALEGERAEDAVVFLRGDRILTLAPVRLMEQRDRWKGTWLEFPAGRWRNVFTGELVGGGRREVHDLLLRFPVGLWSRETERKGGRP